MPDEPQNAVSEGKEPLIAQRIIPACEKFMYPAAEHGYDLYGHAEVIGEKYRLELYGMLHHVIEVTGCKRIIRQPRLQLFDKPPVRHQCPERGDVVLVGETVQSIICRCG